MTPERWQRAESLARAALERPPSERPAFLTEGSAGDARLGRHVALKCFRPSSPPTPAARAASSLNRPNIVTVHEFGECEGLRFIVTDTSASPSRPLSRNRPRGV